MIWEGHGVSACGKSAKTKYPHSEHSPTPHFTALFYILDGQPFQGASPVNIRDDNAIGLVRKLIKEERNPILREVDPGHLSL